MVDSVQVWGNTAREKFAPARTAAAEEGEGRYEGVVDGFEVDFSYQYEVSNRTSIRYNTGPERRLQVAAGQVAGPADNRSHARWPCTRASSTAEDEWKCDQYRLTGFCVGCVRNTTHNIYNVQLYQRHRAIAADCKGPLNPLLAVERYVVRQASEQTDSPLTLST